MAIGPAVLAGAQKASVAASNADSAATMASGTAANHFAESAARSAEWRKQILTAYNTEHTTDTEALNAARAVVAKITF